MCSRPTCHLRSNLTICVKSGCKYPSKSVVTVMCTGHNTNNTQVEAALAHSSPMLSFIFGRHGYRILSIIRIEFTVYLPTNVFCLNIVCSDLCKRLSDPDSDVEIDLAFRLPQASLPKWRLEYETIPLDSDTNDGDAAIITGLRIQPVAGDIPDLWVPVLPEKPAFETDLDPMSFSSDATNHIRPIG
ncbi:hypothetical protein BDR22DRAFT_820595 [Usnea florida]